MLPMAPNRNVVESKLVPPQVQHRLIETQNAFFRDTGWRRRKLNQSVVDKQALPLFDASQQMPERERDALARLGKHDRQIVGALLRCVVFKIKSRQSSAELWRRILKVRSARTRLWPRLACCARRNE